MICPSRRSVSLYPFPEFSLYPMRNTGFLSSTAKCDYAASAGDRFSHGVPGPESLAEGDSLSYQWDDPDAEDHQSSKSTGVIYQRSEIVPRDITDGLTRTYLVGEKFLKIERYENGVDGGDDGTMYAGADADNLRWTIDKEGYHLRPRQDIVGGKTSRYEFGSTHTNSLHTLYCDGSVHDTSYSVDRQIHSAMSNRHDEAN